MSLKRFSYQNCQTRVMFKLGNNVVALYKIYEKDKSLLKPYKILL